MFALYAVHWTEFERGWGSRPDGYSFHESKARLDSFVKRVESTGDASGYDLAGTPEILEVSEALYNKVMSVGDLWTNINNKDTALIWKASV